MPGRQFSAPLQRRRLRATRYGEIKPGAQLNTPFEMFKIAERVEPAFLDELFGTRSAPVNRRQPTRRCSQNPRLFADVHIVSGIAAELDAGISRRLTGQDWCGDLPADTPRRLVPADA